jgi:hypothetical protein
MYGSTPTGRSQSYGCYVTHAKTKRGVIRVPIQKVDQQIPDWLGGIMVDNDLVPAIRETYQKHIQQVTQEDRGAKLSDLKAKIAKLQQEEAHLTRLAITGKISEDTFEMLHAEWKEKLRNHQLNLAEMEQETELHLDDLDVALLLMLKMKDLYDRLEVEKKTVLLRILAKRING